MPPLHLTTWKLYFPNTVPSQEDIVHVIFEFSSFHFSHISTWHNIVLWKTSLEWQIPNSLTFNNSNGIHFCKIVNSFGHNVLYYAHNKSLVFCWNVSLSHQGSSWNQIHALVRQQGESFHCPSSHTFPHKLQWKINSVQLVWIRSFTSVEQGNKHFIGRHNVEGLGSHCWVYIC